jgi:pimeloyl-ACP methyl ester carboxylesterase
VLDVAERDHHVVLSEDGSRTVTASDWTADAHGSGRYAEVNGIYLDVETHGAGRPMVLLHGGVGSGEMFGEVRGLQVPTLLVAADADMAPPSHSVEVFELLDGGLRDGGWMGEGRPKGGHALAILPGLTHDNIVTSPLFAAVTLAFLDQQES